MTRLRPALILTCAALLAGCGDDEETSGDTAASTSSSTTATTATTAAGPSGELTDEGIGAVTRGTPFDDAVAAFGEPDSEQEVPGCELGANPKPQTVATYELSEGELIINFDSASGEMLSYRTTSAELETTAGDRVGDTYDSVQSNWGVELEPLDLGAPATPEQGLWSVVGEQNNQLLFDVSGGEVQIIYGGLIEICE